MSQGNSRLPVSGNQFRVILVVAIGLWFGARYARGVLAVTDTQHQLASAQQNVADAKTRRDTLQQRLAYVKTDDYIESMARQFLLLVKPGDVSVKVVPNTNPAPAVVPPTPGSVASSDLQPVEQWRDLFFPNTR